MPRLIVAREDELLVAASSDPEIAWTTTTHLQMTMPVCLAADPNRPARLFCGTMGSGLWRSEDAGDSWVWVGDGLPVPRVTAVAVSATEDASMEGVVYAGGEPSVVYRSENGGGSWTACGDLQELDSYGEWSFPPRPDTHHVRWIECDPVREGWIHVGIEAGATIRSRNAGTSWEDRKPGSPIDVHKLAMHSKAPGRLFAAAGDGYFESVDHGNTWTQPASEVANLYLWSIAVDSRDPELAVVSASPGPSQAHNPESAYSRLFRRVSGGRWVTIEEGVPDPKGTVAHVVTANAFSPGIFYAASNRGVIRSTDGGATWSDLPIDWPAADERRRVRAIAVVP